MDRHVLNFQYFEIDICQNWSQNQISLLYYGYKYPFGNRVSLHKYYENIQLIFWKLLRYKHILLINFI